MTNASIRTPVLYGVVISKLTPVPKGNTCFKIYFLGMSVFPTCTCVNQVCAHWPWGSENTEPSKTGDDYEPAVSGLVGDRN